MLQNMISKDDVLASAEQLKELLPYNEENVQLIKKSPYFISAGFSLSFTSSESDGSYGLRAGCCACAGHIELVCHSQKRLFMSVRKNLPPYAGCVFICICNVRASGYFYRVLAGEGKA